MSIVIVLIHCNLQHVILLHSCMDRTLPTLCGIELALELNNRMQPANCVNLCILTLTHTQSSHTCTLLFHHCCPWQFQSSCQHSQAICTQASHNLSILAAFCWENWERNLTPAADCRICECVCTDKRQTHFKHTDRLFLEDANPPSLPRRCGKSSWLGSLYSHVLLSQRLESKRHRYTLWRILITNIIWRILHMSTPGSNISIEIHSRETISNRGIEKLEIDARNNFFLSLVTSKSISYLYKVSVLRESISYPP